MGGECAILCPRCNEYKRVTATVSSFVKHFTQVCGSWRKEKLDEEIEYSDDDEEELRGFQQVDVENGKLILQNKRLTMENKRVKLENRKIYLERKILLEQNVELQRARDRLHSERQNLLAAMDRLMENVRIYIKDF